MILISCIDKPSKCDFCGAKFSADQARDQHVRSAHTNERYVKFRAMSSNLIHPAPRSMAAYYVKLCETPTTARTLECGTHDRLKLGYKLCDHTQLLVLQAFCG